ncbi:MAG: 50S ribosomal protein L35 [Alphaproteobacteria bacterium]|nr:50S ribosomal protein L35 [Alphaproteobacteria bacterium]
MPKMKTHSSAKKRFKITAKGRVKFKQAFTSHMMMNKPKSMKRKARGLTTMSEVDERIILRNSLPYGRKRRSKITKKTEA